MKTLLQLLREFWLPLVLGIVWTLLNVLDKPKGTWTVKETLNIFGPTFFFMSWLVAQWYRVKKQQRVEEGISGLQADMSSLRSPLLPCCLMYTLKRQLSDEEMDAVLAANEHESFLPAQGQEFPYPLPSGVTKARINLGIGRYIDYNEGKIEGGGVYRLKHAGYNSIHAEVERRFATIREGEISSDSRILLPAQVEIELFMSSAPKNEREKASLTLRTGPRTEVVSSAVEILDEKLFIDLLTKNLEVDSQIDAAWSTQNLKNSRIRATFSFMFVKMIREMPDRAGWPRLHNLQLWIGPQANKVLTFSLDQLELQVVRRDPEPLAGGDAEFLQIVVECKLDEAVLANQLISTP